MNKWVMIIVFTFTFAGCSAYTYIAKVPPDFTVPPPIIMKRIPLNAALLIPDDIENFTFTGKPATEMGAYTITFPLGQLFKKGSLDIFLHAFNNVTIVKGKPDVDNIDIIIIPEIEKFQYEYEVELSMGGPFAKNPSKALSEISIKYTVIDKQGIVLWEKTISSPKISGKTFNWYKSGATESAEDAAAKAMAAVLQKSVEAMVSSREIDTYAANKGKHETIAAKSSQEAHPTIKSDVDDLPAIKAKPNKNAYAIVIGVEKYRQNLPKADYADHDARIMAEYLTKVMGYPEENIVTLINDHAAKSDFEKYFEKWLSNNVEKEGTVFVYYSGHGAPNPNTGDAYLVPYDGDPSFIEQTGYSLKRLYQNLNKLPAKEIIVVLDSCFSGAGGRSVLAKGARPLVMNLDKQVLHSDRIAVLSASAGNQISSTHEEKGHGLFTYFFLKGIKDGNSELGTLYNYLKPQVERIARKTYNNEQTPGLIAPKGLLNLRLYSR